MPAFFFERNKYRDAFTIKFVFSKRRCFGYLELLEEEEEEEAEKKKKKHMFSRSWCDCHCFVFVFWCDCHCLFVCLFFHSFPIKSNLLLF